MDAIKQQFLFYGNKNDCLPGYKQICSIQSMENLAKRLIKAREARGLTQAELAAKVKSRHPNAKVTQQGLAGLESGKNVTSGYIAEIAEVLNVNTDWLAMGRGPRDRHGEKIEVTDPKLISALKLMEPMAEYKKDQAIKILDTLAQPNDGDGTKKTGNG